MIISNLSVIRSDCRAELRTAPVLPEKTVPRTRLLAVDAVRHGGHSTVPKVEARSFFFNYDNPDRS
jgi:hypothetical protein